MFEPTLTASSEHAVPRFKFQFVFITTAQVVGSLLLISAALGVVGWLVFYTVVNLINISK